MLCKSADLKKMIVEKPRGGEGSMEGSYAFQANDVPEGSVCRMLGRMVLTPGSSIGYHQHADDEELYLILSGEGTFYDEHNRPHAVGPGDMTATRMGESHGIANTGTEPLVLIAVVAKR